MHCTYIRVHMKERESAKYVWKRWGFSLYISCIWVGLKCIGREFQTVGPITSKDFLPMEENENFAFLKCSLNWHICVCVQVKKEQN